LLVVSAALLVVVCCLCAFLLYKEREYRKRKLERAKQMNLAVQTKVVDVGSQNTGA
jgi:hypothetical protein